MTGIPALEAQDLYRFFHVGGQETQALRGVSLRVDPGDVVAITGPSGSGKSTLLTCLAGLDEPDGGMVRVCGEPLSRRTEPERARLRGRNIGMLFQSNNLLDHLTVEANVVLAQRLAQSVDHNRVPRLLDQLGLSHRRYWRPSQLSGGEAARAGLAVALANNPRVLLADEPTGELDATTASLVLDLLFEQADAGSAVVIVTHNPLVAGVAMSEIRLRDGVVVSDDRSAELAASLRGRR